MHSNDDKKFNISGCTESEMIVTREFMIGNIWYTLSKETIVYIIEECPNGELQRDLRQVTRLSQDWNKEEDFLNAKDWVICWIPKFSRKAQIRKSDLKCS